MKKVDGIWQPTVTETGIYGFLGEYSFLSNFFPAPIMHRGVPFPTSEHLYMAFKTLDWDARLKIATIPSPAKAKAAGYLIKLRDNWEEIKVAMMYQACMLKFQQNLKLEGMLLDTRGKYLEETNYHGDKIWGVCEGEGLNLLGKTLMAIREELNG